MSWFWRVLGWSAVLALPCWLAMPHYQRALTAVVNGILAIKYGDTVTIDSLEIIAPCELGLFVALCLAARRAPLKARRFALAAGIPIIVTSEIALVVAAMVLVMSVPREGEAGARALRMNLYLLRTVPWAASILTWYGLLGTWEMPSAAGGAGPRRPT